MPRHFARKFQDLSFVALFVAIVSILVNPASLLQAQARSAVQALAESFVAVAAPETSLSEILLLGAREKGVAGAEDSGSVSFLPAVTYPTGGGAPESVTIADVNGDGKPDLLVANFGNGTVGVLLGNGDGTFQSTVDYDSGGGWTYSVAAADVKGDGKLDLVVVSGCASGGSCSPHGVVGVLLGNGDGTFQPATVYDSGGSPSGNWIGSQVTVADVNGDGKPDIVVANFCAVNNCVNFSGEVSVLLGNGDGTFQPAVPYPSGGYGAYRVVVADVNGDGKPDLIVANCNSSNICNINAQTDGVIGVLLGNGDGTFQAPVTYDSGGQTTVSVAVADVNGDGKLDVLASSCGSQCDGFAAGVIGVLLGNGDGTFQAAVDYPASISPDSVVFADVNLDDKPDLVVGNWYGSFCVLNGNGDGTFQQPVTFPTGSNYSDSVAVADLNGDGKPDVVLADTVQNLVSVLLNNTVPPTSTTLTSSLNPSNYGHSVTFTAAVTSSSGTPTGTVIFYDGTTVIGSSALSSGSASFSTSSLPAGSDPITAAYQGSASYAPSTSAVLTQVVNGTVTTTSVGSSLNPSGYGQSVTFTAAVTSGSGTPSGTVIFYDGSTVIGSATLSNGMASLSTSSLPAGSQSITAAYQGSGGFDPSTSSPLNQVVNPAATTTSLVSSVNPARTKQTVTYTATVTIQFGAIVTGSVTFQDDGTPIATVALSGNQAAYSTSYAMRSVHAITATYSGDANDAGSTSSVLIEVIGKEPDPSETTLASSGSPSMEGQPVTFTATVTSKYGAIPDGELVTFYDGKTEIGTGTTAGSVATFTTSSLTAKTHHIKATYAGDATFKPSTGRVTQVVDK